MRYHRLRAFFHRLAMQQRCPKLLSRSFCMGTYIAFCPFVGLHTVLIVVMTWLLGLELTTVFAAAWLINNPWTMVPVYGVGYAVGHFFLDRLMGIDSLALNPYWMERINSFLAPYLGVQTISFWAFMLGGNLLGIGVAVMLYPVMKRLFTQVLHDKQQQSIL